MCMIFHIKLEPMNAFLVCQFNQFFIDFNLANKKVYFWGVFLVLVKHLNKNLNNREMCTSVCSFFLLIRVDYLLALFDRNW